MVMAVHQPLVQPAWDVQAAPGLDPPTHCPLPVHRTPLPEQTPLEHVSVKVQKRPSLQLAPLLFVKMQV